MQNDYLAKRLAVLETQQCSIGRAEYNQAHIPVVGISRQLTHWLKNSLLGDADDLSGLYVRISGKEAWDTRHHVPGKADQPRGSILDRKPGL